MSFGPAYSGFLTVFLQFTGHGEALKASQEAAALAARDFRNMHYCDFFGQMILIFITGQLLEA